jgi:hypothetical protein
MIYTLLSYITKDPLFGFAFFNNLPLGHGNSYFKCLTTIKAKTVLESLLCQFSIKNLKKIAFNINFQYYSSFWLVK